MTGSRCGASWWPIGVKLLCALSAPAVNSGWKLCKSMLSRIVTLCPCALLTGRCALALRAVDSYLNAAFIVSAALTQGADAIHPDMASCRKIQPLPDYVRGRASPLLALRRR